jgi:hypothetical protein
MFKVARVGNFTESGGKIITGSATLFTDMGGGGVNVNVYKGNIFAYTAEEASETHNDDIDYDSMSPEDKAILDKAIREGTADGVLASENGNNNNTSPISVDCDGLTGEVTGNLQLSPHFKLKDFTTNVRMNGYQLKEQAGFTVPQLVCNLRALSVNCAEKLLEKYGRVNVNSGFRHGSGKSQHERGQAADFQWDGLTQDEIWARALWVRDNVNYDQFILEYSDNRPNCWFHLSFNRKGNRKKVNTYHKSFQASYGTKYPPGLKKMR